MRRAAVAAILLLAAVPAARAQDSNYWSSAYGTRALLLGGVVTGSRGDISSVYYNPGALALAPSTELLLAGNVYEYSTVKVEGGSGPGRDLTSSNLGAVPGLFAGELPVLKHDRLAYSFLTRTRMDLSIEEQTTTGAESVAPLPGATSGAFEFDLGQDVNDTWNGLTWAHKLSSNLGIGITPYVAVRSQRTRVSLVASGTNASNQSAIAYVNRDFDYLHWRALARLGLSGVRDSLTYGLTLTTPSFGIFGSGSTRYNTTLVDNTDPTRGGIAANYQKDLKVDYRSPLGVGGGASFGFGPTRIHAAAEWYAKVSRYDVVKAEPFTYTKTSGDTVVDVTISEELKEVFNVGVGIEHRFRDGLFGYASYHTDKTGQSNPTPPRASITNMDLQHVAGGVTFRAFKSDFAVGLSAAFGSQHTPRPPARPDGVAAVLGGEVHSMTLTGLAGWKIAF